MLLNGLNHISVPEGEYWYWFSILADSPDSWEKDQYSKYPIKSAKVFNTDLRQFVPYTATSVFDNLNRLVEFKGYFYDGPLYPRTFKINYYK